MPDSEPDTQQSTHQHTVKFDELLERRVQQAMGLEGLTIFNEAARVAMSRWSRDVVRDHGLDPNAPPPPLRPKRE